MKNEFILSFNEVIEDKQLPREVILMALESAMVSAYKKAVNPPNAQCVEAKIDPDTGKVTIFAEKEVVDSVQDDRTEVLLEVAKRYDPQAEMGMMVMVESTPDDFGRVAAQTARQVMQQRLREAERQAQLDFYVQQIGETVSGLVQAVGQQGLTIGLEMRAEGALYRKDMIPRERFRLHDRVRALVAEVKDSSRGPQIILSRTHRDFLRRLLENEVPEIYHGVVEIRSIAREPGERAKVAVSAAQAGIDPVGACVGIRGVRIQAIVRELHDEKIDVIEWSDDPTTFIAKAISPARVTGVYLVQKENSRTATVVVSEDQLSLAIGRDGQNARLAAKLTGWRIDIKSLVEATTDTLNRIKSDVELAAIRESELDMIPVIENLLVKKIEGRPLNPEEFDQMAKFVDRVEKQIIARHQPVVLSENQVRRQLLKGKISADLFKQNILDSGLPDFVNYILQEAGIITTGDLILEMKDQPDNIMRLQGVGPRAMTEIESFMEAFAEVSVSTDEIKAVMSPEEVAIEDVELEGEIVEPEEEEISAELEATSTQEALVEAEVEEVIDELEIAADQEPEILAMEEVEVEDEEEISEEPEVAVGVGAATEVMEEDDEKTFDELFAAYSHEVRYEEEDEEVDEMIPAGGKKKSKKRKYVEVEYDPDEDVTVYRKKRKKSGEDWEEWEQL